VVTLCKFSGSNYGAILSVTCPDEEYHAASSRDLLYDLCGSAQMSGGDFERDDVHALPYAVDVAGIGGVPE
jgi:hypothetical protein